MPRNIYIKIIYKKLEELANVTLKNKYCSPFWNKWYKKGKVFQKVKL